MLKCPKCKGVMTYINIVSHFENDYEWDRKTNQYEPYAQCPDQGDIHIECEHCGAHLSVSSCEPNDIEQAELDGE